VNFYVEYPAKPGNLETELYFQRTNFNIIISTSAAKV